MSDCNNIPGGSVVTISEPQLPYCQQCGNSDCVEIIDSQCVIYHSLNDKPTKLENLGMPNLSTAEAIFEAIDDLIGNGANIPITRINTDSIRITANGAAKHTIKADLNLSQDAGNSAVIRSDGLYVPTTSSGTNLRFGVAGEDVLATQARTFNAANAYDITFNAAQFIVTGTNGAGTTIPAYLENQMFFNPRKAAFRAGVGLTGQWNDANVGSYSVAFGANNTASANYTMSWGTSNFVTGILSTAWGDDNHTTGSRSTAWGQDNTATEYCSTAFGELNTASGQYSTVYGRGNVTDSYAGVAVGHFCDNTPATDSVNFNVLNRAFQVGYGTGTLARKNAFTVLYNGKCGFGTTTPSEVVSIGLAGSVKGTLSLAGDTSGKVIIQPASAAGTWTMTLPQDAGNATEVLSTDGAGVTYWATAPYNSGTYTPTTTNDTNIEASTSHGAQWLQVGNVVTVSGAITLDPIAAALTSISISLPVVTVLNVDYELAGVAASGDIAGLSAAVNADIVNNMAQIRWTAVDLTSQKFFYHFTYRVQDEEV